MNKKVSLTKILGSFVAVFITIISLATIILSAIFMFLLAIFVFVLPILIAMFILSFSLKNGDVAINSSLDINSPYQLSNFNDYSDEEIIEILKQKYVKGEITEEELEKRLNERVSDYDSNKDVNFDKQYN